MTDIKIQRVSESKYELLIDNDVVETYNQSKMKHPWDWAEDATANGATQTDIKSRNYDYDDLRFES